MSDASPWIIETNTQSFEADVIQKSMETPVVVDFWAPWCAPCQQLAPALEKVINEYGGKIVLVKVDIDQEPQIAQAFGVQSIPHVFALQNGQPVDQFAGILSEQELREWMSRLVPSPAQQLVYEGQMLEAEDPAAAEAKYREALALDAENSEVQIRIATVVLAQERDEEARKIIDELEQRGFLEPEAEAIKSELDLRAAAADAGGIGEARQAAEANPDDLGLQLKLADALAVNRKHEEALQICLTIITKDKAGVGVEAKETMVKIFDVLGPSSELTGEYRRKLSTLLY